MAVSSRILPARPRQPAAGGAERRLPRRLSGLCAATGLLDRDPVERRRSDARLPAHRRPPRRHAEAPLMVRRSGRRDADRGGGPARTRGGGTAPPGRRASLEGAAPDRGASIGDDLPGRLRAAYLADAAAALSGFRRGVGAMRRAPPPPGTAAAAAR